MSTEPKQQPDWQVIEIDYRAGLKPLRQIAEEHGISHTAIGKRAKHGEWVRDLGAKIKAQADAKVSKAAVSKEVSSQSAATEKQVVEANAELQYRIRMEHRQDIGRSRRLFQSLLRELEIGTDHIDLFEQIGEIMDESGPDANGTWKKDKINEIYRKVISLGGRVTNAKQLTETLEKLVRMEREAFGIDTGRDGEKAYEEMLQALGATR